MITRRNLLFIMVTIVLLAFSIFAFIFPAIKPPLEGDLTVKWSRPSGIRFDDLKSGDILEVQFQCDLPVGIYLLSKGEAEDLRSPSFYKEPLPPPYITGLEGRIRIEVPENGDYELLFWNESFSNDHIINYSIETHLQKDVTISLISGSSLIFLSFVPPLIWFLKRDKTEKGPPVIERFK